MPRPRERDPSDKIKGKGSGRVQKDARRQLTAKFRKELAQRKRGGAENYEAQAVDQTEEVAAAAIEEVTQQTGRGGQRASAELQKHRQEKQRQHRQEAGKRSAAGPGITGTGQFHHAHRRHTDAGHAGDLRRHGWAL